jgi:hypothetical protein
MDDNFDYEDKIAALKDAFITRDVTNPQEPALRPLCVEFDLPHKTIKDLSDSQNWAHLRYLYRAEFSNTLTLADHKTVKAKANHISETLSKLLTHQVATTEKFSSIVDKLLLAKVEEMLNSEEEIPLAVIMNLKKMDNENKSMTFNYLQQLLKMITEMQAREKEESKEPEQETFQEKINKLASSNIETIIMVDEVTKKKRNPDDLQDISERENIFKKLDNE